jgi:NAD(P)-dependent dehydrogenase (short-subunit alcohol dehydrogenase family)
MGEVWVITGVSTGLGRAMALAALDAGHTIVGTLRKQADVDAFEALAPGMAHGIILDLADLDRVPAAIQRVEAEFGAIRVLINNAGYGLEGPLETIPIAEMRRLYDANLFGAMAAAQAVIAPMRSRGRGHIVNVSSVTALVARPAIGAYASSKAAMNVLSEVMAQEIAPFGIKVTTIMPGSFRTDWAGRSLVRAEAGGEYAHLDEQRAARSDRSGKQAGDPARFAAAVLELVAQGDPPPFVLLGASALTAYRLKIEALQKDLERSLESAPEADFPPEQQLA